MAKGPLNNPLWNELQQLGIAVPWRQLHNLQNEVNRLFDRWTDGSWRSALGGFPAINVWEDGEDVFIETELPGVAAENLEILVTGDNQLTLKGERKAQVPAKGVWHRQERGTGSFTRTVSLPFNVDREKVDARMEHGVLTLKLAKHVSAKPRKIAVKAE
jgi:HSP20 family protein